MMSTRSFLPCGAMAVALALTACNSASPPPAASVTAVNTGAVPGVTPPGFRLPDGAGCTGDIGRWQAIQQNDLDTGHVNKAVHEQIQGEIALASVACQAGRDAEARALIAASKRRHGYPG